MSKLLSTNATLEKSAGPEPKRMANLLQHVVALLYAVIDREEILPPEIVEAAEDLEPHVTDAINHNLDPYQDLEIERMPET